TEDIGHFFVRKLLHVLHEERLTLSDGQARERRRESVPELLAFDLVLGGHRREDRATGVLDRHVAATGRLQVIETAVPYDAMYPRAEAGRIPAVAKLRERPHHRVLHEIGGRVRAPYHTQRVAKERLL